MRNAGRSYRRSHVARLLWNARTQARKGNWGIAAMYVKSARSFGDSHSTRLGTMRQIRHCISMLCREVVTHEYNKS